MIESGKLELGKQGEVGMDIGKTGQGLRFLFGFWPVLDNLRDHPQTWDAVAHYVSEMKRQYDLAEGEQFGEGKVDWEPTAEDSNVWWLYIWIPIVKVP